MLEERERAESWLVARQAGWWMVVRTGLNFLVQELDKCGLGVRVRVS